MDACRASTPLAAVQLYRRRTAQLPPAFEQRHQLIRQQFTAGDFQPLAPAIPESEPEVQRLLAVADPRLPGRQRWPVSWPTAHATSGAQPFCRTRSSLQPWQRLVRCSPWAIKPWCRWQVSRGMQFSPAWDRHHDNHDRHTPVLAGDALRRQVSADIEY